MIRDVGVYTVHGLDRIQQQVLLPALGQARRWGIHWYHARPPVVNIDFEMDLRGVVTELHDIDP